MSNKCAWVCHCYQSSLIRVTMERSVPETKGRYHTSSVIPHHSKAFSVQQHRQISHVSRTSAKTIRPFSFFRVMLPMLSLSKGRFVYLNSRQCHENVVPGCAKTRQQFRVRFSLRVKEPSVFSQFPTSKMCITRLDTG